MESSKSGLQGDSILFLSAVLCQSLGFLLLLEPAEIVLDEERGVEFSDSHLVFH